ncbi:unnamed protein product [Echinostoma caproni]|uniref:Uncharacterized protein n=1 Tax=Echinostoma caproni TaxID=27848 RepID=A0A183B259_9TREM|nr:unnamed protein product [Echinostoma caproni]
MARVESSAQLRPSTTIRLATVLPPNASVWLRVDVSSHPSLALREILPYDQASRMDFAEEALPTAFSWRKCLPTKVRERKADIRDYKRLADQC